jgi:hypothetical protein
VRNLDVIEQANDQGQMPSAFELLSVALYRLRLAFDEQDDGSFPATDM